MPPEEFRPFLAENRPKMFAADFSCMVDNMLTEEELAATSELAKRMGNPFFLRLGVFHHDKQVGWSFGAQIDRERFYMVNSAIFPEHRNKGLYTALLDRAVTSARVQGFQMITSRHTATNSPILIAKMKAGFIITGFELSDSFGFIVNLTYFTNPLRRKVMDFRAGQLAPDDEVKRLFNL